MLADARAAAGNTNVPASTVLANTLSPTQFTDASWAQVFTQRLAIALPAQPAYDTDLSVSPCVVQLGGEFLRLSQRGFLSHECVPKTQRQHQATLRPAYSNPLTDLRTRSCSHLLLQNPFGTFSFCLPLIPPDMRIPMAFFSILPVRSVTLDFTGPAALFGSLLARSMCDDSDISGIV